MSRRVAVTVLVVFLFLVGILAALALAGRDQGELTDASPTPEAATPTPVADASPIPVAVTVEGEVLSVSPNPVTFMNARLIRVQEASGITPIYVTDETGIRNDQGMTITLNALRIGDVIEVTGETAEDGVLASQVVVTQAAPTPMPTPTPTPEVTEE